MITGGEECVHHGGAAAVHFIPYYGKSAIIYGYNSLRKLTMHGREYVQRIEGTWNRPDTFLSKGTIY